MRKVLIMCCTFIIVIILCSCNTDPSSRGGSNGHIYSKITTMTITQNNNTAIYFIVQINGTDVNIPSGATNVTIDDGIRKVSIYNIQYYDDNAISFDWTKFNDEIKRGN